MWRFSKGLLSRFRLRRRAPADGSSFVCNICGAVVPGLGVELERETPSCPRCHSTVRMRSLVHVLSMETLGRSLPLPEFPVRRDLRGLGMSDWGGYAQELAQRFDYENRFYDRAPKLDITRPPSELEGRLDFLISTDVFEHVQPPVEKAFENARRLLKPSGVLVFSVPYMAAGENIEHFPSLHDYRIDESGSQPRLINVTVDGESEIFDDLVFHGGEGLTLEMRVFSEPALLRQIEEAGFAAPRIYGDPVPEFGIRWSTPLSLPMALRPGS